MSQSKGVSITGGGGVRSDSLSSLMAAAHELKSPLVLIRQLSLAAQDYRYSAEERDRLLSQLTLVADRGLRLTSDLTRTASLEDALIEAEPLNAQQLCELIVREIEPLYEQYGRSIILDTHRTRPLVLAHRELLRSIIYHFADNALHYGDDTGPVKVSLQYRASKRNLRIGVRDYGPALSPRDWKRVLGGSKGLPTRPQASGLGLRIAEQFSHAMGATIGLIRHRDGATFYVEVPVSEQLSLL